MTDGPLVGVMMGSHSDWDTIKNTASTLESLGISWEARVLSAHRTPDETADYAAEAQGRGIKVIIAAAGGAAALPGAVAAKTPIPVIGVPVKGWATDGLDSLLSMAQMPRGVPVATVAIGRTGRRQCRAARRTHPRVVTPGDCRRGQPRSYSARRGTAESTAPHAGLNPRPMAVHQITTLPRDAAVLRTPARRVRNFDASLRSLVADMIDSMNAAHGVGIAAPQIGIGSARRRDRDARRAAVRVGQSGGRQAQR